MLSANDLRSGVTFEIDNDLYVVISFQHVKPGKGSAFVRVKIKNLNSGNVTERTYRPEEKFKKAFLDRKNMQYSYKDGDNFVFMDLESYEQFYLPEEDAEDARNYLKENLEIQVVFFKGKPVSVELPTFVELTVVSTEPGVKGDTATSTLKPAVVETGYKLSVPLFVNQGDTIRVDTRTGEYLERVNK